MIIHFSPSTRHFHLFNKFFLLNEYHIITFIHWSNSSIRVKRKHLHLNHTNTISFIICINLDLFKSLSNIKFFSMKKKDFSLKRHLLFLEIDLIHLSGSREKLLPFSFNQNKDKRKREMNVHPLTIDQLTNP